MEFGWYVIWGVSSFLLGGIFGVILAHGWPELFRWAFVRGEDEDEPEIIMTTFSDHE